MNLFEIPETTRQIALRPYQEQCLQAVEAGFDSGVRRGLIVLPTGAGKTTIFSELVKRRAERSLILAHRTELLDQAAARLRSMGAAGFVGVEGGDLRADPGSDVVVAGVQSIGRERTDRLSWFEPRLVIVDEAHHACFVAGTSVDGRAIETISEGDLVWSYNHGKNSAELRRVKAVMATVPRSLVRVTFADGRVLICTPDHPLFDGTSYVPADRAVACARLGCDEKDLCGLRGGVHAPQLELEDDSDLLGEVPDSPAQRACESGDRAVPRVRSRSSLPRTRAPEFTGPGKGRKGVLLGSLPGRAGSANQLRNGFSYESAMCVGSHESQEPDGRSSGASEGGRISSRSFPRGAGRKRAFDGAPEEAGECARLADGGSGANAGLPQSPTLLQSGHRFYRTEDSCGSRRQEPSGSQGQSFGRIQDDGIDLVGVESVEILEPGRDGTYGGLCPGGLVYNIEVERNHNYFAEGFLVHNCADSYMTVLRRYGCFGDGARCLGVTATPHRLDNKPLHGTERSIFESVLFQYTLREAIEASWLCDLRGYRVQGGADLTGVKSSMGDFNAGQLASRVDNPERNVAAYKHWAEVARDRRTVVFCCTVDHARHVAELFQERGVRAECVHGGMDPDERGGIMGRFRTGETQVLTNVEIVTEGVDVPEIGCVLLLRPTQSWALYTQMVGRGLRPLPDKPDCIVIDVVDASAGKSLASCPGLLGLPPDLDLEGNSLSAAAKRVDQFSDGRKAALFRRPTTFSGLFDELTEVDLLAELAIPEEAAKCSRFGWLKLADDQYRLSCGGDEVEGRRAAVLAVDPLGAWSLRLVSDKRDEAHGLGDDLRNAFRLADALIRQAYPGVSAVADRSAPWRSSPPSEKQIGLLKRMRVQPDVLAALDKGQASQLITKLMAEARR